MAKDNEEFAQFYDLDLKYYSYDFRQYLLRNEKNLDNLNKKEKQCLTKLKESEKEQDDENAAPNYDEDSLEWDKLVDPFYVAYAYSMPNFLLSATDKNNKNYIIKQVKEFGPFANVIAKENLKHAQDIGAIGKDDEKEDEKKEESEEPEEPEEDAKVEKVSKEEVKEIEEELHPEDEEKVVVIIEHDDEGKEKTGPEDSALGDE